MAKKRIAHKIELYHETTKILNLKKIGDPSMSREAVNVDCLDTDISTDLPHPVLVVGDLQCVAYWDEADTNHTAIAGLLTGTQPEITDMPDFKIKFPFGKERAFKGWVKELGEAPYEVGGEVLRDITIRITSLPVTSDTV